MAEGDSAESIAVERENLRLRRRVEELETLLHRSRRRSGSLQEINTLLTSLIESTDDLIMVANALGEPLFFNTAYAKVIEEFTGAPPRPGEKPHERLPEPEARAFWDRLHERALSGEKFRVPYEVVMPNGERRAFELSFNPIWADGQVIGFAEFTHELTEHLRAAEEQQALQEQLLQAQKMEALGKLAGGMAHDFNNLLAVMLGSAELIVETAQDARVLRQAKKIVRVARRARDLTTKLLAFARRERLETQTVTLGALLADVLEIVRGSVPRSIEVREQVRAPEACMDISLGQVSVALLNVCINAADAMPQGGVLELGGDLVHLEVGDPRLSERHQPGHYCHIWVSDSGMGMDEQTRLRATEPFFTTKGDGRGTGLGLSVSLGVVEAHHGLLRIESEPGVGTKVHLYLPVAAKPLHRAPVASPQQVQAIGPRRVLVVDDDDDFRATLCEQVQSLGYEVVAAVGRGTEALLWIREHPGQADLVLLDLVMPGLSGRDTYSELQNLAPGIPVLLCSGYSEQGDAAAVLAAGAAGYLQKPFDLQMLSRAMRRALDSPAGV